MAEFLLDTFTGANGTDVTTRAGETGATWTLRTGASGTIAIQTNRAIRTSGSPVLYASGAPLAAEYDLTWEIVFVGSVNNSMCVWARMATDATTGYRVRYRFSATAGQSWWALELWNAGAFTLLANYAVEPAALTLGQTYGLLFEVRDANKRVLIDGVERLTSADNTITAAGRVGIEGFSPMGATAGGHLDRIAAADPVAAAAEGPGRGRVGLGLGLGLGG